MMDHSNATVPLVYIHCPPPPRPVPNFQRYSAYNIEKLGVACERDYIHCILYYKNSILYILWLVSRAGKSLLATRGVTLDRYKPNN